MWSALPGKNKDLERRPLSSITLDIDDSGRTPVFFLIGLLTPSYVSSRLGSLVVSRSRDYYGMDLDGTEFPRVHFVTHKNNDLGTQYERRRK